MIQWSTFQYSSVSKSLLTRFQLVQNIQVDLISTWTFERPNSLYVKINKTLTIRLHQKHHTRRINQKSELYEQVLRRLGLFPELSPPIFLVLSLMLCPCILRDYFLSLALVNLH